MSLADLLRNDGAYIDARLQGVPRSALEKLTSPITAPTRESVNEKWLAIIEGHLRATVGEDKAVTAVVKWALDNWPGQCGEELRRHISEQLSQTFADADSGPRLDKILAELSPAVRLCSGIPIPKQAGQPTAAPVLPTPQKPVSQTKAIPTHPKQAEATRVAAPQAKPVQATKRSAPRAPRSLVAGDRELCAIANQMAKNKIPADRIQFYLPIVKQALKSVRETRGQECPMKDVVDEANPGLFRAMRDAETPLPENLGWTELSNAIRDGFAQGVSPPARPILVDGYREMPRLVLVGGAKFSDDDTGKICRPFWKKDDALSNYAYSEFTMTLGEKAFTYKFAEQAFQEAKVRMVLKESERLLKDGPSETEKAQLKDQIKRCKDLIEEIRSAPNADRARSAAQEVEHFIGFGVDTKYSKERGKAWGRQREIVMRNVLFAKFNQNLKLKAMLLGTGDDILAEMSSADNFWGTGFEEGDSRGANTDNWGVTTTHNGKAPPKNDTFDNCNRLGTMLMELRKAFRGAKPVGA